MANSKQSKIVSRLFVAVMLFFPFVIQAKAYAQLAPEIDQHVAETNTGDKVHKLDWNPDGFTLAAATSDGLILYNRNLQMVSQLHSGSVIYSVSWNPEGTQLAVTQGNNVEIWQWEGSNLSQVTTLQGNNKQINVLWRPDGTQIASVEGFDIGDLAWLATIKFWDVSTWSLRSETEADYEFLKDFLTVNQIAWEPGGASELIVVGDTLYLDNGEYFIESTARIRFINTETGVQFREIPLVVNYLVTAVGWHPSGDAIAVGAPTGMDLYDTDTGDFVGPLNTYSEAYVLAWSPDGRYIIGNNRVFDPSQRKLLGTFLSPPATGIDAVVWHPDGSEITIASTDGGIQLEDATLLPDLKVSPTSDAGSDQTVTDSDGSGSEIVMLDGTGSEDPDGTIVSYVWSESGIQIATGSNPQVNLSVGVHTIMLTVTDNDGATDTDAVVITVNPPASSGVLNDFNRSDGAVGANWSGDTGDYSIASNQLVAGGQDTAIIWNPTAFGANQEAAVTIVDADSTAHMVRVSMSLRR